MNMIRLRMFLWFLFLFLATACNQNKTKHSSQIIKHDSIVPPVTVIAGTPVTPDPDTCLPPLKIVIPAAPGSFYSVNTSDGLKKIRLFPPEIKPAGYLHTFYNFNAENGLALNAINCGYRDKKGNLWFGTDGGGVSRYDGTQFTNFTTSLGLSYNGVTCILEDKSGNLWFGTTGGGVNRYDGKTFRTFTTAQGLADDDVRSMVEDKSGNLWFGTYGSGVSRYNGKSFKTFNTSLGLSNNDVTIILEDRKGNLWFGTNGGGVSRFDGKTFKTFTTSEGLPNNIVRNILEDKDGNLWFGTYGGGVSRYDGKTFTTFTTPEDLSNNDVRSSLQDKAGILWFGTYGGGVSFYDGKTFKNISPSQGLSNNSVFSITEDKNGNLWFGTDGGGIACYEGNALTYFTTAQGLSYNSVTSIAEDRTGSLWFGTCLGVCRYDGKTFTNFRTGQGLWNNYIYSVIEDKDGNLWFGTYGGGVSRYDGKSFTNYTTSQGLSNNNVRCILEDKAGNLWLGTYGGGVSRYNGKTFTNYTTSQGLSDNVVWNIAEDKSGNLWFGTYAGVCCYDGKTFTNFTTSQGLSNNIVRTIAEDKAGNLWFGTDGGVSVLRKERLERLMNKTGKGNTQPCNELIFENFTTKKGLADDNVLGILEDSSGNIIIGTNLGFTILKGGLGLSGQSFAKEGIEYYNQKTGYPINDIANHAMFLDSHGIIWAGTSDKLVRFDYKGIYKNPNPVYVYLKNIKINNENICWNDLERNQSKKVDSNTTPPNIIEEGITFGRTLTEAHRDTLLKKFGNIEFDSIARFYPIPQNLVLPYKNNNITIDFGAIETSRPKLVRYQYILEGYDANWNPVTDRPYASFGNIREGTYIFKLKAQSPDGVWSKPITYIFRVLPPWYRTWWIYLLYVLIILASIILIFQWRTAALRREKEMLEKKVKIRTDQLRNEKDRSDELLLNILPSETAEELKKTGSSKAKYFDEVTVLFTDFKDFTQRSEQLDAQELVNEINFCYSAFDNIITKYGLEKIKTIGDSYMCAGGLPVENKTNPVDTVMAALEIRDFMIGEKEKRETQGKKFFEIRIGVHTGPVVAGIVGIKKFAYDIWGDTVNIASRMESGGEAGEVNISGTTYELVKDKFNCFYRGKIATKHKVEIDMYFAESYNPGIQ